MPHVALGGLEAEARTLWAVAGGAREGARTFWLDADASPRCGLERLALAIVRFHYPTPAARRSVVGAEFWTQLRSSADEPAKQGLSLHYDKDEVAVETWDIWAHPELATATYLTGGGAPLLVFSTCSRGDAFSSEEDATEGSCTAARASAPSPERGWVCFPRAGRHVAFDGRMLHGVPEELLDLHRVGQRRAAALSEPRGPTYSRLSFLVNVWTSHRPERVRALSTKLAEKLSSASVPHKKWRRALRLHPGQPPVPPWRRRIAASEHGSGGHRQRKGGRRPNPSSGLYALREHLVGDTGLLPTRAVALACRGALAGPAANGIVEVHYFLPKASGARTCTPLRRPSAAPPFLKRPASLLASSAKARRTGAAAA